MVTTISAKTRETAEQQLERLQRENEQLRAKLPVTDIVQGKGFMGKEGEEGHKKIFIKLFQINPKTEFPMKGEEVELPNGHKFREYIVGKWLWVDETELYEVVTGKAKSFHIYWSRKR